MGILLLIRVHSLGKDSRFDKLKHQFVDFFFLWTVQGLWVFFCGLPVFLNNRKLDMMKEMGTLYDYFGIGIYSVGLLIEIVADQQKYLFKLKTTRQKKRDEAKTFGSSDFVNTGLWKLSRHPNYVGEMLIWVGIYIFCYQEFTDPLDHIAIISPLFIITLLAGVSAPMIEKEADKRWGDNADYLHYKENTPYLIDSRSITNMI